MRRMPASRTLLPVFVPLLALLAGSWLAPRAAAQLEAGGEPASTYLALPEAVPTVVLPPVDVGRFLAEDAARGKEGAFRFGENVPVDLGPENAGTWEEMPSGMRVWRLRVRSIGAYSLSFLFARYELPAGAGLWVYDDARETVRGAYTARNNKANGQFAIQPVAGDALVLEYVVPPGVDPRGTLRLSGVVHDYRDILSWIDKGGSGAGDSACETDVNCPQGAPWTNQINATTLLINGGLLCSGSLLNNATSDGTQYYITANHCGGLNNAVFRFKYQRSGCGSGSAPTNLTVQGSVQKATNAGIDFRLVEITEPIPLSFDPFFAGWDRSGSPPTNTVTTHHPQGGVKKISFDNDPPGKTGTDWKIFQWDLGVTEPGSSGCPLYDPQGRFIGQLWGGQAACGFPFNDFFGRLDAEWNLVSPYLDPLGSGVTSIAGFDPSNPGSPPVITSLNPSTVQAFLSGTVSIQGSGFAAALQVFLDTQSIPFTVIDDTQIDFAVPQPSALGGVAVTVVNGAGTSNAKTLTYVETSPPKHTAPATWVVGTLDLPVSWGGGANDSYLFGVAAAGTTVNFHGFPILAGMIPLLSGTLDAIGYGPTGYGIPLPPQASGLTLWHQVWTVDLVQGLTSFEASTAKSTLLF